MPRHTKLPLCLLLTCGCSVSLKPGLETTATDHGDADGGVATSCGDDDGSTAVVDGSSTGAEADASTDGGGSTDAASTEGGATSSTGSTTGSPVARCSDGVAALLGEDDPVPFATIAEAVAAAPQGGLVRVCPGTHVETVEIEQPLTLEGAGPELTTWQPTQGAALVVAAPLFLRGFTFTGGTGAPYGAYTAGGAVYLEDAEQDVEATLEDLVFVDNSAQYGGALYIGHHHIAELTSVVFADNSASVRGGALSVGAHSSITMTGCTFTGNVASGDGGALYSSNVNLWFSILDSVFTDNVSGGTVGALRLGGQDAEIIDSIITDNVGVEAGGLLARNQDTVTIEGTTFHSNVALDDPAATIEGRAGGILYSGSILTVTDSDFGSEPETDNSPYDVALHFEPEYEFGDGVSFTCSLGSCQAS